MPTALGFATWSFALARGRAGRAAALNYLIPVVAIGLGWAYLGERPPPLAVAGGALCVTGVYLARRRELTRRARLPPSRRVSRHRDLEFFPLADPADPDDWRPNSVVALVSDRAADVAVIAERIAPGDAIPLHRHTIDEVILYLSGEGEARVGDDTHDIRGGDVLIIPAGSVHGTRNTGDDSLELRAFFPSARIDIEYVERNPAPGTESDRPQPPIVVDTHELG
jgi:quercetin dioxygenase-like cupin family protein